MQEIFIISEEKILKVEISPLNIILCGVENTMGEIEVTGGVSVGAREFLNNCETKYPFLDYYRIKDSF